MGVSLVIKLWTPWLAVIPGHLNPYECFQADWLWKMTYLVTNIQVSCKNIGFYSFIVFAAERYKGLLAYYIDLNDTLGMDTVEKIVATIFIACHPMRLCITRLLLLLSTIQLPRPSDITLNTLTTSNGNLIWLDFLERTVYKFLNTQWPYPGITPPLLLWTPTTHRAGLYVAFWSHRMEYRQQIMR